MLREACLDDHPEAETAMRKQGEEEARNGAGRDVLTGYLVPGSVGQGGV